MQSIVVRSQDLCCFCYSGPRRSLPDTSPSTVTDVRTKLQLPIKLTSAVAPHQRTTRWVVSSPLASPTQLTWTVTHRHILVLNLIASAAVLSAAWLFIYAIPALLDLRKAAESLEKQLDVAREQLPEAMAAVRLSGMEISDLTMELSDLGQEITHKVRRGTDVFRVAEENLRQFASLTSTGAQARAQTVIDSNYPPLAKSARRMKEGIVKSRSSWLMFTSFIYYIKLIKGFSAQAQEKNK